MRSDAGGEAFDCGPLEPTACSMLCTPETFEIDEELNDPE